MKKNNVKEMSDAELFFTYKVINKQVGYLLLINRYKTELRKYVLASTKNVQLTNDILQNTFLQIWDKMDLIEPQNIKGWFLTLTINNIKAEYNKLNKMVLQPVVHSSTYLGEDVTERDVYKVLNDNLQDIPKKRAMIFKERFYNNKTEQDIADQYGISISCVRAHYSNTLNQLFDKIKTYCLN